MTNPEKITFSTLRDYLRFKKGGASSLSGTFAMYKQLRKAKEDIIGRAPSGDGHPVLIIPGFTEPDSLTRPFRKILEAKGYKAYGWKGKLNLGMSERKADHLKERLEEIYKENGGQKVTVIGRSLGGFYARALAQEFPEMVRASITVCTPFGIGIFTDATPPVVMSVIKSLIDEKYSLNNEGVAERLLTPPVGVPTTSIYSKKDTVAGWQACLNPATPLTENIEVETTHFASVWHPGIVEIILDRLSQPEGKWRKHKDQSAETPPPNPNWKPKPNSTSWHFFKHP